MNILLQGGQILTMENDNILQTDIGISDDRIAFIGSSPAHFRADKIIDASRSLIMPGLVNAHSHISMSLLRNYADDLPFWTWLFEKIMPVEDNLTSEYAYHGAQLSTIEMIRSGTTTFADMYFFMDKVAQAVEESGLRANLSRGVTFINGDKDLNKLEEAKQFFHKWHDKAEGRIKVDIAPHAVYTCPPKYIKLMGDLAEKLGCNIHIHLSESRKELDDSLAEYGKTPIQHVNDLGLFKTRTYAAHCVQINDEDIRILKDNNVSVINNPTSNMKLANGFAPVTKMLAAGVNVALGTDGSASNNNMNLFEEIHLAALLNKAVEEDPTVVPAYTALKMATINGAKALGLDDEIGSLKKGKKADLIMIDLNKAHFYPRYNLVSSLVYSAQASDVKTVLCNGKILMEDYNLLTIDEEAVCVNAELSSKKMTARQNDKE